MVALNGEPRHRVRGLDEVREQPVNGVLAAEDVAAANIVPREDEDVRVLDADHLLEEGRRVCVAARVLLLARADVLAEQVARVVDVADLDNLEGTLQRRRREWRMRVSGGGGRAAGNQ